MRSMHRRLLIGLGCLADGLVITIALVIVIVAMENRLINRAATASGLTAYRFEQWGFIFVTTKHPEFPRYWSSHLTSHLEVGWPLPCVRTEERHPNRVREAQTRMEKLALLRHPMPAGLLANTGIFGLVLWTVLCGPGILLRGHRARGGRCPFCGYPAGESALCTECGRPHGLVAQRLVAERLRCARS